MGRDVVVPPEPDSVRTLITSSGYEVRPYQLRIIKEILLSLAKGESTIVNIPQGLGKTFISQVVAVLDDNHVVQGHRKVLFLVPTRALATQHVLMARWMQKHGRLLVVDQSAVRESFVLRKHFEHAAYVIATPILLENRLASIRPSGLANVKLCIIDEIDTFSVTDWPAIRFHRSMGPIVARLIAQGCVFVGLTASRVDPAENAFWQDRIRFRVVTAYETDMLGYLPFTLLRPIGVTPDGRVSAVDGALTQTLTACHRRLSEMGISHTIKGLQALISKIASGQSVRINVRGGRELIDGELPALQSLCLAMKAAQNAQVALFEDTIKPPYLDAMIRTLRRHLAISSPDAASRATRRAIQDAADSLAQVARCGALIPSGLTPKESALMAILHNHREEKGLVFCRFTEIAEYLHSLAMEARLRSTVIHARLAQHDMLSKMAAYRWDTTVSTIFMTRDLGGRGLDFPTARFLVLYSPRSNFVSADQEVCRIRSNREDPKPAYLLYYSGTAEEPKAATLMANMDSAQTLGGHKAYDVGRVSQGR